jgi:hypothetical protein
MSDSNIYDTTRNILARLEQVGAGNIAREIDNIISGGSTGSEILMGIRWKFRQFMDNPGQKLPSDLQGEIDSLLKNIDKLLGP